VTSHPFGRLADGEDVHEVVIAAGDVQAHVLSYGAILRDLRVRVNGDWRGVVLGFDTLAAYLAQGAYIGAIAGRYANRIAGGRFTLDGKLHELTLNERGRTHLHGGNTGFDRRNWRIVGCEPRSVRLALHSPAGEEGYPGTIDVTCTYRLAEPVGLIIELAATTDAPTIINLTGHSYFNLDGSADIRDHRLMMAAQEYLPVEGDLIPEGGAAPVAGTDYDFRVSRPIRRENVVYDNNFIVAWQRSATPRRMARLASPKGDLAMELHSTEPGLQFYDGAYLDVSAVATGGKAYGGYGGLCLEPQCFPDTPNRPEFPSCVLRPGDVYRHVIEYRFTSP
jgi:aldose 1-epimerase